MSRLSELPQWHKLQQYFHSVSEVSIRSLFSADSERFGNWSQKVGMLFVDYSKHRLDETGLGLLIDLARARQLELRREQMFRGELINFTEKRAALHTALRSGTDRQIKVNGTDVIPQISAVMQRMSAFVQQVRSGEWIGYSGKPITDVVNIGIGGSDLGPRMLVRALDAYTEPRLNFHFVANVDGAEISTVLERVDPERVLFIVESKTFSTIETMTNAATARQWLLSHAGDPQAVSRHFVAVSTNTAAVSEFGIDPANMFEFWDWVGGRYSVWSAIGLPVALAIGMQGFTELLEGARLMDAHFQTAPLRRNLPVLLGLIGIWYCNFHGCRTHAILPYAQPLALLPDYLQQAEMESNGKCVTREGETVDYATAPVLWGGTGVNGQHAFFQLLHQGTQMVPADFIIPKHVPHTLTHHQQILYANFVAQTEALLHGRTSQQVADEMRSQGCADEEIAALAPHRSFPGNRPSTSIVLDRLCPQSLGSLLALYEHKIFVQGVIWDINSFDQWGVELGKQLAGTVLQEIQSARQTGTHDPSTAGLIRYYLQQVDS